MDMDLQNDSTLKFIFGRRSIRAYAPGHIEDGAIERLLHAAMAAPSAMTKDPWRFVVVRDREKLTQMKAALPGGGMLATAELAVLVCGDLDAAFERNLSYLLQDCSAAIENLLLAAHATGLGACWVGVHPSEAGISAMRTLFGVPASVIPVAAIALGYPGEQPPPRSRYRAESVHFEKWGSNG